jgi:hypothetical protein
MELGQYQLQIFVSLVVILGAAFVALICDFLKGNNEQLRELTVELKVRREEEQRRSHTLTPQLAGAPAMSLKAEMPVMDNRTDKRAEKKAEARAARSMATSREPKRPVAPEALAAMERGAQLAGAPRPRAAAAARSEAPAASRVERPEPAPAPVVEVTPQTAAPMMARQTQVAASKPMAAGKKDWNSLLSRRANKSDEVIDIRAEQSKEDSQNAGLVPAGFHDGFILSKLVQKRQPVSGLVVSIGVNTPREADGSMPEAVKELVQSLIGADDFACQSNQEEFLLIYPNAHGASAQRKLSQIAQQLWDFQLSSMGSFSILFSWGGVEVASESIDEAIASANQRMQETRRSRKLLTMQPRVGAVQQTQEPVRQAV